MLYFFDSSKIYVFYLHVSLIYALDGLFITWSYSELKLKLFIFTLQPPGYHVKLRKKKKKYLDEKNNKNKDQKQEST